MLAVLAVLALAWTPAAVADAGGALLIQGGTVVNAHGAGQADVLLEGGKVVLVGQGLKAPRGARTINAKDKLVIPGGIDPHTHLAMPFMGQVAADDFFTGHTAALAGGTTMHVDFALPIGGMKAGLKEWRRKAERAAMSYGFHMAVTSWDDQVSADMAEMVKEGINSFKFFLAYKGALMVTDDQFLQGLVRCKELGVLPMVHAENGDAVAYGQKRVFEELGITGPEGHMYSRPSNVEAEATARAIRLAEVAETPIYVVHVMSKDAMLEVAAAKARGQRVVGEPVVSGMTMDESMLLHPNFTIAAQYVMSPPIRKHDVDGVALQGALASGVLDLVGTDHAVFNSTQKAKGKHDFRIIPNGVNGLEERMVVVYDTMVSKGLIDLPRYVEVTSTAAAKVFNAYPQKGCVCVGSDADLVVFDPSQKTTVSAATHHSAMDTNIYEGRTYQGKVDVVVSQGEVVFENGKLTDVVKPGRGKFVPLGPHMSLYEGMDKLSAANTAARVRVNRDGSGKGGGKDEL